MSVIVNWDRYIEPRCIDCGHTANSHSGSECHHKVNTDPWVTNIKVKCSCSGYVVDLNWPRLVTEGGNADLLR